MKDGPEKTGKDPGTRGGPLSTLLRKLGSVFGGFTGGGPKSDAPDQPNRAARYADLARHAQEKPSASSEPLPQPSKGKQRSKGAPRPSGAKSNSKGASKAKSSPKMSERAAQSHKLSSARAFEAGTVAASVSRPHIPVARTTRDLLERIASTHDFSSKSQKSGPWAAASKEMERREASAVEWITRTVPLGSSEEIISIGFDLGSTSSKVVVRFPYNPSLAAFAVPAPTALRADKHPYYWKTELWQRADKSYALIGSDGGSCLDALKVSFLRTHADDPQSKAASEAEIHVTAYMALMLRQTMGWLIRRLPKTLKNSALEVSANFGFPAERVDDNSAGHRFRICCQAAIDLALSDTGISDKNVLQALSVAAKGKRTHETRVVPEFIGAVVGFFNSSRRKNGKYILCDFGGLTCDCVCFGFYARDDGSSVISIYGARVQSFGSEVVDVALGQGVDPDWITKAMGSFVAEPIKDARHRTGPNSEVWGGEMPLFRIGGGRHNGAYKDMFSWTEKSLENSIFRTKFHEEPLDLEQHGSIDVSVSQGRNNGRLLVALGLSWSIYDMPDWLTPGQIRSYEDPSRSLDIEARFIGPEQM
ncbi:hypothetical protein LZA78_02920 [Sinirhodobacter sp. WL0062]|uniref:Uncharacterized protein n=1 Tax=Rhodobacter flavimaris TaxID=2907145 RepID=A0ABS8YRD1_9RHOB|nr:hypothetical protein [Sinirhodobacter sp. WL0062]MCE5972442.1 hypothetical protein [Sinirhodobacter sp. WL0062]